MRANSCAPIVRRYGWCWLAPTRRYWRWCRWPARWASKCACCGRMVREPPPGLAPEHYDRRALGDALQDLHLDADSALYSLAHDAEIDLQVARRGLASPSPASASSAAGKSAKVVYRRCVRWGIATPRSRVCVCRRAGAWDAPRRIPSRSASSPKPCRRWQMCRPLPQADKSLAASAACVSHQGALQPVE